MRALLAAMLLLLMIASPAAAVPVEQVPDPRPTHAVVDLTGTLSPAAIARVDAAAARGRRGARGRARCG